MTVLYEPLRQQAQHLAMLVGGDTHTAVTLDEIITLINTDRDELLVIFGPGVPLSEAVSFASTHRIVRPALGVVLLRPHLDLGVLSEALRAGVREVADINDPAAVRIEETGIRTMMTAYCPGVDAMLAPVQPAIAEEVTRDLVADLIDLTRR